MREKDIKTNGKPSIPMCPLLTAAERIATGIGDGVACRRERCAWWIPDGAYDCGENRDIGICVIAIRAK